MKKILMVGAALLGTASAQTATQWQYATYTVVGAPSLGLPISHNWIAPEGNKRGKDVAGLLAELGCQGADQTAILNCVGAQGWELVTYSDQKDRDVSVESYIFKKTK